MTFEPQSDDTFWLQTLPKLAASGDASTYPDLTVEERNQLWLETRQRLTKIAAFILRNRDVAVRDEVVQQVLTTLLDPTELKRAASSRHPGVHMAHLLTKVATDFDRDRLSRAESRRVDLGVIGLVNSERGSDLDAVELEAHAWSAALVRLQALNDTVAQLRHRVKAVIRAQ